MCWKSTESFHLWCLFVYEFFNFSVLFCYFCATKVMKLVKKSMRTPDELVRKVHMKRCSSMRISTFSRGLLWKWQTKFVAHLAWLNASRCCLILFLLFQRALIFFYLKINFLCLHCKGWKWTTARLIHRNSCVRNGLQHQRHLFDKCFFNVPRVKCGNFIDYVIAKNRDSFNSWGNEWNGILSRV